MIGIAMIAGSLMSAQYGYPPSSGSTGTTDSYQNERSEGLDTTPFVQLQRKCFEKAMAETENAATDVRQQRFGTCLALHDAMVKHATARLGPKEAATAKRDLDRALGEVEKSFAKRMSVAIPEDKK